MKQVVLSFCLFSLLATLSLAFEDDDRECKRHQNEGRCVTSPEGDYTCGCLFHEKPLLAVSAWNATSETRYFTQTCEQVRLPYHEDTCVVLLGNPQNEPEYEFLCPNNGYFQTWGAFAPLKGSYSVRLWYRCCNVKCPKWNCQWTPFTETQNKFLLPLEGAYVQGVRGRYEHHRKDSSWSLQLCSCDFSIPQPKEEL